MNLMGLNFCKYIQRSWCRCCCSCSCCCCHCNNCKYCKRKPQNSVGIVPDKKLKLLLLGISGSGKTEIAHYLSKAQRLDYDSTNGVHNYSFKLSNALCSLTEIGGSDDMQRIWHHYYVGTMAVIYCFDMSSKYDDLKKSFKLLQKVLKNPYIMAKPILLVATKADLADDSIQLYDIENTFHIQRMAVTYGSSIKLCCYDAQTEKKKDENLNQNLRSGIQWLSNYLLNNYSVTQMRLNCDKNMQNWEEQRNKLVAEGKLNFKKYQRFPKSSNRQKFWRLSHKRLRRSLIRPRTAPAKVCFVSTIDQSENMASSSSFNLVTNSSSKVPNGDVNKEA